MTIAAAQPAPPHRRRPSDVGPLPSPSHFPSSSPTTPGFPSTDSQSSPGPTPDSPSASSSSSSSSGSSSSRAGRGLRGPAPIIAIHPTLVAPLPPKQRHKLLRKWQGSARKEEGGGGEGGGGEGRDRREGKEGRERKGRSGSGDSRVDGAQGLVGREAGREDFGYRESWSVRIKKRFGFGKRDEVTADSDTD